MMLKFVFVDLLEVLKGKVNRMWYLGGISFWKHDSSEEIPRRTMLSAEGLPPGINVGHSWNILRRRFPEESCYVQRVSPREQMWDIRGIFFGGDSPKNHVTQRVSPGTNVGHSWNILRGDTPKNHVTQRVLHHGNKCEEFRGTGYRLPAESCPAESYYQIVSI